MISIHTRDPRMRTAHQRGSLAWVGFAVMLVAWWMVAAPTDIGGPATFAIVRGSSMTPTFHDGDLVIARVATTYSAGDVVIFHNPDFGTVVHRLVAASPEGWLTRGDGHTSNDPWTVPPTAIEGAYVVAVPGVGTVLAWVGRYPLFFGGMCGALALLAYAPWHRRRWVPALTDALTVAQHESWWRGHPAIEYAVLAMSSGATLVCIGAVTSVYASHRLVSIAGAVSVSALLLAGGLTAYFVRRVFDGVGMAEPARSMHALSGRLYLVSEFPALDETPTSVTSAKALRSIAEKDRMPILHLIDPDAGTHEFLLLTAEDGAVLWRPVVGDPHSVADGGFFGATRIVRSRVTAP